MATSGVRFVWSIETWAHRARRILVISSFVLKKYLYRHYNDLGTLYPVSILICPFLRDFLDYVVNIFDILFLLSLLLGRDIYIQMFIFYLYYREHFLYSSALFTDILIMNLSANLSDSRKKIDSRHDFA